MKYKWIIFIPAVIFIYLLYASLLPFGGAAIYNIDVGADDLQGMAKLQGPVERISEPEEIDGITFRNLQAGRVYFNLKSPNLKDRGEVTVKVIFRDNFPEGQKLMVGAKNNDSPSYAWKELYVPFYEVLKEYPSIKIDNKQVITINAPAELSGLDDMPEGSVISANTDINLNPYVETIENTGSKNLSINVTLRGSHTFYTYVDDGALNLNLSKQDLNWNNGTDELKIEVYSDKDKLIGDGAIPDDGEQNKTNILGPVQKAAFSFSDLDKGVYRIELISGIDLLIREIEIDKGRLVVEGRLFVVGSNPAYFKSESAVPVEVYFKNPRNSTVSFQTYHAPGLQNITMKNGTAKTVDINRTSELFSLSLEQDETMSAFISEKGNVIIDSINYFSFTEDSYFTPKKFRVVSLKPDPGWVKDNVDYVILEYDFPEGNDWKTGRAGWNMNDLYIKDNTLSFSFNVPHLGREEFRNYTIPVDRIEIEVKTPPIWERIR
ncbi:hypothetical protein ANME2D_02638 [Candidatus Methanoperedens nitroreducens]|uniref:Uncharacterized protein n=1 Tax=Candidatus Methanoperedens nitratireducens TaxID=1392998 RepID=A0A062UZM0_9EURY|nr:hypothetical protein [Candidatus Methanoperedens nitroreducens]KCZ70617.1 hypothetical protein ANME2D_02638 [Candidatus Methanoperedens nitroreducens]MDJ1420473.1 hypothetical protein [Candidatus Methanoperedens sp.]